jgi:hypothetical protein
MKKRLSDMRGVTPKHAPIKPARDSSTMATLMA